MYRSIIGGAADHEGKYVGNDKTGWTYISKDGALNSKTFGFSGQADVSTGKYKTSSDVLKDAGRDTAKRSYTSAFFHSSSPEADKKNIDATTKAANTNYNLCTANCGQAAAAGDKAAGIPRDQYGKTNPQDDHKYMQSEQGKKDGWVSVAIPAPKVDVQ